MDIKEITAWLQTSGSMSSEDIARELVKAGVDASTAKLTAEASVKSGDPSRYITDTFSKEEQTNVPATPKEEQTNVPATPKEEQDSSSKEKVPLKKQRSPYLQQANSPEVFNTAMGHFDKFLQRRMTKDSHPTSELMMQRAQQIGERIGEAESEADRARSIYERPEDVQAAKDVALAQNAAASSARQQLGGAAGAGAAAAVGAQQAYKAGEQALPQAVQSARNLRYEYEKIEPERRELVDAQRAAQAEQFQGNVQAQVKYENQKSNQEAANALSTKALQASGVYPEQNDRSNLTEGQDTAEGRWEDSVNEVSEAMNTGTPTPLSEEEMEKQTVDLAEKLQNTKATAPMVMKWAESMGLDASASQPVIEWMQWIDDHFRSSNDVPYPEGYNFVGLNGKQNLLNMALSGQLPSPSQLNLSSPDDAGLYPEDHEMINKTLTRSY